MTALAIVAAVALAGESLPPQNTPVNITQVKGSPIGNTNSVPVTCVAGCGGGSGGGAVDQGAPAQIDGGWPVILVDQNGNQLGTVSFPLQVAGGGSGSGGGAAWDGGVIVQYPVAIASLWDAGVLVQNFPEEPDSGAIFVYVIDPGGGGQAAAWDAGVLVQNFPASFGASQTGNWSVLVEYDGGPLPVAVSNFPSTQAVSGTVQVLQDSFPWQTLAPPDWDAGVEVLNFPGSFGASQTGSWSVLIEYDAGPLPIAGIVTADQGTVPWQVSQDGAWTALLYYDGGPLPVSGAVSVSNFPTTQAVTQSGSWTVSATQGTSPWVMLDNQVEPDSGVPWVYVVNPSGGSSGGGGTVTQGPASSTPDSGWWVNTAAVINGGTSNVLCGNSDTALGSFAGSRKSIEICNQNPVNPIYICTNHPGCSSPNSIDAGTVVGEALAPGTCLSKATSLPMVCVSTSGTAQVSPDAGTVVVEVL